MSKDIYPENEIDFDGTSDPGISPLIGIGMRGSLATTHLLLKQAFLHHEM